MHRVADLVRAVIDYRFFAILLLNDRTNELWMRFQTGHVPEIERIRIKLGTGVVGQAALQRKSLLIKTSPASRTTSMPTPTFAPSLRSAHREEPGHRVIDIQSEHPVIH